MSRFDNINIEFVLNQLSKNLVTKTKSKNDKKIKKN
jgi:hypothetical protein